MKTSEQYLEEIKMKHGEQMTRDGKLIRDMDDRELMKRMLERYPGERENIVDVDEFLGEEVKVPDMPEQSDAVKKLDAIKKSPSFLERANQVIQRAGQTVRSEITGEGENANESPLRRGFEATAAAAMAIPSVAKEALPEFARNAIDFVGEKTGEAIQKGVITPLAETDLIKGAAAGYNAAERGEVELSPLAKAGPEILGTAAAAGEIADVALGAKGAAKGADVATNKIADVAPKIPAKIDEITEPMRKARAEKAKVELENTVRRITQATDPSDIKAAKNTLGRLDVDDVNSYKEFSGRLQDDIAVLSDKVDAELNRYPEKYKSEQLGTYTKVGNETVVSTPVQNALNGLQSAYEQSGEVVASAKIRQLKQKLETEGLTVKELNDLAREYNIEFKDRAFTKMGDPKPGYNAENYENTRKGIKEVVRERMPDDVTKELDKQISESYTTRDLVSKLEQEVAKAENKVRTYSLPQKVGRGIYSLVDLATIGTLTGLVSRLNLKAGKMYVSRLELNDELQKNFKKLQKLNEQTDPKKFSDELNRYIEDDLSPGLGIRATVNPQKVADSMTRGEFRIVASALDNMKNAKLNPDFNEFLKKNGLQNAEDDVLERFLKDTIDEYEGVADKPVQ